MDRRLIKLKEWLDSEIAKDEIEINKKKQDFIEQLKKIKKEDMFVEKKMSLLDKFKKIFN